MNQSKRFSHPSFWTRRLPVALLIGTVGFSFAAPIRGAEASAFRGRTVFKSYCRTCHGDEGRGDGPLAEHLKVPPADLTRLAAANEGEFPTERARLMIDGRDDVRGHGSRDMPIWGEAFLVAEEGLDEEAVARRIDDLIAYLQSIQAP